MGSSLLVMACDRCGGGGQPFVRNFGNIVGIRSAGNPALLSWEASSSFVLPRYA